MKNNLSVDIVNLSQRFFDHALNHPDQSALTLNNQTFSYSQLAIKVTELRQTLKSNGLKPQMNILVMLPMSQDLVVLLLALIAQGCVPVLIDPRLGLNRVRKALKTLNIQCIFSVNAFFRLKWIWPSLWSRQLFTFESPSWRVQKIELSKNINQIDFNLYSSQPEQSVLITMTSGTTGEAKIIHRKFAVMKYQQFFSIKYLFPLNPDRHLAFYPISILQSLIEGAETFYMKEADLDHFFSFAQEKQITRLSGPPQILLKIIDLMQTQKMTLPHVQHILLGGAAIPRWLVSRLKMTFPQARIQVMYGATECEPIAASWAESYLSSDNVGYCLGTLLPELEAEWKFYGKFAQYQVNELILKGPNVVNGYFETGDLFYLDSQQQLWFLGRSKEAVDGIPVGLIEEPLERMSGIQRVAFKKIHDTHYLFLELSASPFEHQQTVLNHLKSWGFENVQIRILAKIPVDVRHGWKIQRHLLDKLIN